MITRRTKIQLVIFVVITLLGVSFVGARYAQLDRLVLDDNYKVTASFADSGGIFSGAEVSYRGVTIGKVGPLRLTGDGVDVTLMIDNGYDRIPAETKALVGNRSAVGEQYVELQPQVDNGPYLKDGSTIAQDQTSIPISSTKFLSDTQRLVDSVPQDSLRTVVSEFGSAFNRGGGDLARLIDSSTSFIDAANDNFDTTTQLIRDSNTVLGTQLDKASAIRSFSRDLAAFSGTLAQNDGALRTIIANGSATATQLRGFLEDNKVDLTKLINNLVTTGEIGVKHLAGTKMVLVVYPYVMAGGFAVIDKTPSTGQYDAHFGLILTQDGPVCHQGYGGTDRRTPQNTGNRAMNEQARCTEPASQSNPRGAQNAPRVAPGTAPRRAVSPDDVPVIGSYDRSTGRFTYSDQGSSAPVTYTGGAQAAFGKESWKWLLLQPVLQQQ